MKVGGHVTPIGVTGKEWILAITLNDGQNLSLPIAQLSRAGSAVVDLLGRPDERLILRKIAKEVPAGSYSRIIMGRSKGDGALGPPFEQLFPEAPSFEMSPIFAASPFAQTNLSIGKGVSVSLVNSTKTEKLT